jgi:peptidyl-dipeptidase Dcp
MPDATLETTPATDNPMFTASALPFSLPPFDLIRDEHYREAFDRGMDEHLAEVEAIAANPEPPTFENTLVALERSGALLSRTSLAFFGTSSSLATDAVQAIEEEYAPKLSAHGDAVRLDPRL